MANKEIPSLTAASALGGTEVVHGVQSSNSRKITMNQIKTLALAVFGGNGIIARTAAETFSARTITAPAAGITVANGDGVSGNPTLALANDLAALEGLASTGYANRTGSDAWEVVGEATAAQFRANTADKVLTTDPVWSAADYVALTDAATVAVDLSTGINFSLTIGGDRTLGAPSNTKNGQTGAIVITQDGTGSRLLSYHANWKFAGGTDPVLSTAAGAIDVLFYQVISSTSIFANLVKAIA